MDGQKNQFLFKVSLLSISLMLTAAPAISALIPLMKESFTAQSLASVELIATVPNFGILIFVLISNLFIRQIGKKQTIMLGLILALVAGMMPVFTSSYLIVLISRFFFGAGIGLFNSLAVSLITEIYDGEEQASMMGLQSAMGSIGSTILTLLVGVLAKYGWHTSYLIYAAMLIPIVLFGLFVKLPSKKTTTTAVSVDTSGKETVNVATIGLMVFALFLYAFFMVLMLKMSTFLMETNLGQPENAASILSAVTIVGIVIGVVYGKIFKLLKKFVLPIGILGMGLGFFIIANASSLLLVVVGASIAGVCFSLAAPYLFILTGEVAPTNSVNLATSLLLVGINLGVFLSPTLVNGLGQLFSLSDAKGNLFICSIFLIGLGISTLVVTMLHKNKQIVQKEEENGYAK
ncbi:MFS transporter [Isobaculum melis]|uniref:Predicted arabinose efflux permease, MFS family n=1 Tax=Isobaculum melis TaxID=142588 RepID=A0A1H9QW57_9LACT|nr:MFS transporter [Isobaculum melis]SER64688.1 Predicted arabinose efflux permease, MFS family [Isobaculum melis]